MIQPAAALQHESHDMAKLACNCPSRRYALISFVLSVPIFVIAACIFRRENSLAFDFMIFCPEFQFHEFQLREFYGADNFNFANFASRSQFNPVVLRRSADPGGFIRAERNTVVDGDTFAGGKIRLFFVHSNFRNLESKYGISHDGNI